MASYTRNSRDFMHRYKPPAPQLHCAVSIKYYYTGSYIALISSKHYYESFTYAAAMQLYLLRLCNGNHYLPMPNWRVACTHVSMEVSKPSCLPVGIKLHLSMYHYAAT